MSKLRELIREIVDEELDETSTTGGVAGFSTPNAFSDGKKKNKNPMTKRLEDPFKPKPFGKSSGDPLKNEAYDRRFKDRAERVGMEIMKGKDDADKNNAADDRDKKKDFQDPETAEEAIALEGEDYVKKLPKAPATDHEMEEVVYGKAGSETKENDKKPTRTKTKAGRVQNSVPYRKGGAYWNVNMTNSDIGHSPQEAEEKVCDDDEAVVAEKSRNGEYGGFGLDEGKYHQFKRDESLNTRQKIGKSLSEMNHSLNEIERVVEMSRRLKVETKTSNGDLWKRSQKALTKMENRLVSLSSKLRELKA